MRVPILAAMTTFALGAIACATTATRAAVSPEVSAGTLAQLYFWRARPGKLSEYSRYVREVAEPIDREAQRRGAFLSVATYVSRDSTTPWTHLRVFILRDSTQLAALSGALDSAGTRLEPDSVKRHARGEYAATLRDRAGSMTVELLR